MEKIFNFGQIDDNGLSDAKCVCCGHTHIVDNTMVKSDSGYWWSCSCPLCGANEIHHENGEIETKPGDFKNVLKYLDACKALALRPLPALRKRFPDVRFHWFFSKPEEVKEGINVIEGGEFTPPEIVVKNEN